jgi:hypothetical protein
MGVLVAGFILWTPVGYPEVILVQGRYILPAVALLAFAAPPLRRFRGLSRFFLPALMIVFLGLSCFETVRIVRHYYFPNPYLRGRNIREVYYEASSQSCPASLEGEIKDWFEVVATGRATAYHQNYRVILSEDDGTILGESDPVLIGGNGSSWRLQIWNIYVDRFATGYLWFAAGKSACQFAEIKFWPVNPPPPPV